MQIGDLARATGVDVETIRFYEKQGLLAPPARQPNGYRRYAQAHLERLAFVRHCRSLDMPLADIHRLIAAHDDPAGHAHAAEALVDDQLRRVRARLASLRALEKQLRTLRSRCSGEHGGQTCGIVEELVAAAHGEACACHGPAQGVSAEGRSAPRRRRRQSPASG